jgi:hypothetical protein
MTRQFLQVVFGFVLLFLLVNFPIWPQLESPFVNGRIGLVAGYVFAVWLLAIVLLYRLSRLFARSSQNNDDDPVASDY